MNLFLELLLVSISARGEISGVILRETPGKNPLVENPRIALKEIPEWNQERNWYHGRNLGRNSGKNCRRVTTRNSGSNLEKKPHEESYCQPRVTESS